MQSIDQFSTTEELWSRVFNDEIPLIDAL